MVAAHVYQLPGQMLKYGEVGFLVLGKIGKLET